MRDYRYTELSYKITSLISRTCCLGSFGLTITQADAGVLPFTCDYSRNITTKILLIHFNNLFLFMFISLEITRLHVRRVLLYSRIYIHTFLQLPDKLQTANIDDANCTVKMKFILCIIKTIIILAKYIEVFLKHIYSLFPP